MNGIIAGLAIPVLGTILGAACVYFVKDRMNPSTSKALLGFAAGVMVAASIWCLMIPAIESTPGEGFMKVFPTVIGFIVGMVFIIALEFLIPHSHRQNDLEVIKEPQFSRSTKLLVALTLHNIPEGIAVGAALAAVLNQNHFVSILGAIALSIGIGIQNIPEGAIVSMPLHANGYSRNRSFLIGALSGVVEPIASVLTIYLTSVIVPQLPYLLAFAAGAMFYVVVDELIPATQDQRHSNIGVISFGIGFIIMLILDFVL